MLGNDLLEGELVRLTAITREDVPLFTEWFANMEFRRYLEMLAMPFTLEDEYDWYEFQRTDPDSITFAIRTLDQNRLIGNCRIHDIRWQPRNCMVGIGIGDTGYWGQGYGSDAMRVLLQYCFMEMDLHRVGLAVRGYNQRAINSYRKVGFTDEVIAREAMLRDGVYSDWIGMAILRREWQALVQNREG